MTGKQLKNSILQLAIQGKLVPQDPHDEPASELLKRIRKEKEQLVKTGKLKKKDLESTPIAEDEKPFEIPESWEWCRFEDVISFATNLVPPNDYLQYKHIAPDNIEKGTGKLLPCRTVSEDQVISNNHLFYRGQIIYSKIRPLLRKCVIAPFDGLCSADMYPLETIADRCFVQSILLSDFFNAQVASVCASRVKMPKINKEELSPLILPLPPLSEQHRIVEKIEKLMPLVEEYDKAQSELDKLNESLPEQLKKSILQQAIMGKLVPQDLNDEPASELLKRIHKEKENLVKSGALKKKDLITTPISDDEKPFDIPESWEWVSLESVIYQVGNKYNQVLSSEIQKEGLLPVVSQSQKLVDGYTDQIAKKIEDIPLVLFGDHTRNVKYIDFPFVIGADGVKLLKPIILSARFLYFWTLLSSSNLRDRGYARHYTLLKEVPFPLPPLSEQHRIVAKIEELFSILK